MKKLIVLAAALAFAVAASAQVYVEGAVAFKSSSDKPDGGSKLTYTEYDFSPSVGYYLNDKFDIGLGLSFYGNKDEYTGGNEKLSGWKVAPFARYSFLQFGKFEVLAKLAIDFGGYTEKDTPDGGTAVKAEYTKWGINLSPILAYNLTDNFVLTAQMDIFELGYNSTKLKDGYTRNSFGFGVDSTYGSVRPWGGLSVGFAYKF